MRQGCGAASVILVSASSELPKERCRSRSGDTSEAATGGRGYSADARTLNRLVLRRGEGEGEEVMGPPLPTMRTRGENSGGRTASCIVVAAAADPAMTDTEAEEGRAEQH
jgi:hypothetical protein